MAYTIPFTQYLKVQLEGAAGPWTSLNADLRRQEPIVCERGIFAAGASARVADPGTIRFTLDNQDHRYSLFHASRRSGWGFGIPVCWTLTESEHDQVQFIGRLTEIHVMPCAYGERAVRCVATDPMAGLLATTFPSGLDVATSLRADELLTLMLALDPDYGVLYVPAFGEGVSVFAYAFDSIQDTQTTLYEEAHRIVMSEGGYLFLEPATSSIVFQQRDARALLAPTAVNLSGAIVEMRVPGSVNDLPTRVDVTCYPVVEVADSVLYSLGATDRLVQPGEVWEFFGPYSDPESRGDRVGGLDFTAVVATTDYLMNTAKDGSGTNLTANFDVVETPKSNGVYWRIENQGQTAGYITLLQLRGTMIARRSTVVSAANAYDPAATRTLSLDLPYENQIAEAQSRADFYAHVYADPQARRAESVTILANHDAATALACRTVNTGDLVSLTESEVGFSGAQFSVNGVRQEFRDGVLKTTWVLETEEVGRWIDVAHSAGDFTASGSMSWTVGSDDLLTYAYRLDGPTLRLAVMIETSTIGGTPSTDLRVALPAGAVAAKAVMGSAHLIDNGTHTTGRWVVAASGTYVSFRYAAGTTWTASSVAGVSAVMVIPVTV